MWSSCAPRKNHPSPGDKMHKENPYMIGHEFGDLAHNLMKLDHQVMQGGTLPGYPPLQLAAIEQQAEGMHDELLGFIRTLSDVLALGDLSELPAGTPRSLGHLIGFLTSAARSCDTFAHYAHNRRACSLAPRELADCTT